MNELPNKYWAIVRDGRVVYSGGHVGVTLEYLIDMAKKMFGTVSFGDRPFVRNEVGDFFGFTWQQLVDKQMGRNTFASAAERVAGLLDEPSRESGLPSPFEREVLFNKIQHGDYVTIITPHGSKLKGSAVMRGPAGWVLNLGGAHGTPGIASEDNVIALRKGRRGSINGQTMLERMHERTGGNPGEEPQKVEKSVIRGTLPQEDLESMCFILRDISLSDDEMAKKISEATDYVSFEAGTILVRAWRDAGRSEKNWENPELMDFIKKQLITKMGADMNRTAIASELLKVAKEIMSFGLRQQIPGEPAPKFKVGDKVKTWAPDLTEIWQVGDYDDYAKDRRYLVMNPVTRHKLNIFEKDIRKAASEILKVARELISGEVRLNSLDSRTRRLIGQISYNLTLEEVSTMTYHDIPEKPDEPYFGESVAVIYERDDGVLIGHVVRTPKAHIQGISGMAEVIYTAPRGSSHQSFAATITRLFNTGRVASV